MTQYRSTARGPRGPRGRDGAGSAGPAGASAYEVAVANGFVGDEAAWLASLVGADGADGSDASVTNANVNAALAADPAASIAALGMTDERWQVLKQAADLTNSTMAPANVPGMSFTAAAGEVYLIDLFGAIQGAATTTGVGLCFDIPSGTVLGIGGHLNNINGFITGYGQRADGNNHSVTQGVQTAATDEPFFGRFLIEVGATGGTVQLMFRSETTAAATLKAKTRMLYRKLPA